MRIAQDIYTEYKIMPSLQLHQLRVAAVAKLLCEHFKEPVKERVVVLACLFHDMGNIIKSDLGYFPEFVEPEGREYWEKVKADFVEKYGGNHHQANVVIAKEIHLPAASVAFINGIGFSKLAEVVADLSWERKIVQYADLRVGPHSVLLLKERLQEGRKRYTATRTERPYYEFDEEFERLARAAEELETQITAQVAITPESIHEAAVQGSFKELRNYNIA